jgi:hypothetical protein
MTTPNVGDFVFEDGGQGAPGAIIPFDVNREAETPAASSIKPFPNPIIQLSDERRDAFLSWLDRNLQNLIDAQLKKQQIWADYERAYRAYPEAYKTEPFEGASNLVVPVIAMSVDPIHARLDIGIWKQDPPITVKGLRKSVLPFIPSVQKFLNYWVKNIAKMHQVSSPRSLESTKLGTMVFKTIYDRETYTIKTYDPQQDYKIISRDEVRYSGPRVLGVSLGDFLFPANYQFLQDCPIVAERMRTTYWKLKIAEASGKLQNVDKLKGMEIHDRTDLESAREESAQHVGMTLNDDLVVYEIWCDYDIDGNDLPEHLVVTYHKETRTILQLRYNWYFNQKKPYVVIPYTVTNESLYGIGLCEMVLPFQQAITKWEQMAQDNAYIANIRMFIVKNESGIEEVPRLYTGRCFFVDDPRSDFIPFAVGDIYPSTLSERQNLFGLVEKRTGVSDYLVGRESPIIGTRATATSTLALIQEGTKRVEEVLENFREGYAEIMLNCISIWMQYGLEGLDEMVLGDDSVAEDVRQFFDLLTQTNVYGTIGIDLTATDASTNRSTLQSMQLNLIQLMMGYYEKLLNAMSIAMQMQAQGNQEAVELIKETAIASRKLFVDLLHDYNIRNPEEYLPDLEKYLNGPTNGGIAAGGGAEGGLGGVQGQPGLQVVQGGAGRPIGPVPSLPGSGARPNSFVPPTGGGGSAPAGPAGA